MKGVLITPPYSLLHNPKALIPLGTLHIASVLVEEGHQIKVVDLANFTQRQWLEKIPEGDIYGVSVTTPVANTAKVIAKRLKERNPGALVICGGAHPTALPVDYLKSSDFDVAVVGEGEVTTLELFSEKPLEDISGIVYKDNSGTRAKINPKRKPIENLDILPFPKRDLLDYENYSAITYRWPLKEPSTSILMTRGCSRTCAYCNRQIFGGKVRFRSKTNVIEELKEIGEKYKIRHLRIFDDNVSINKRYYKEVFQKMSSMGFIWRGHTYPEYLEEDLIEVMKLSGCKELAFGLESASDKILQNVKRNVDRNNLLQTFRSLKKHDIETRVYVIVGLPGETRDTIRDTEEFLEKLNPDHISISTFIPFPGSDTWNCPEAFGLLNLSRDFDDYWQMGLEETERGFVFDTKYASRNDLVLMRKEMHEWRDSYLSRKESQL